MGLRGVAWSDTGFEKVTSYYKINHPLTHNALQDALDQAELFKKMLEEARITLIVSLRVPRGSGNLMFEGA